MAIRVAASPGEAHVAVTRDGRLIDYALWRPGAPDGVGDIHRGRVAAIVPAMAGAFVTLTDAEGFLPDSEGAKGLTVGATVTVRITRAAQGGKGPRLSARTPGIEPSQGPVALLRRGPTPVEILAARHSDAAILVDNPGTAAALRAILGQRVTITQEKLPDDIEEAIDALSRPLIGLPCGVRLSIWPTPALVAVDMDAAGALGRGHPALNRAALPGLADQIRLRNLSGAIVVDVAGLSARRRAALAPDFTAALANDPLRPKFLGFTTLGLAEIVRPRVHPPLHEFLNTPLAAGLAALRAVLAASGPDPRTMPALRAHPAVIAALQADPAALPDLLHRTGRAPTLRADPSLPEMAWMMEKENAC
ncbi:MAG TPA: ribonuclease E/G [Rhodopila sp.]|nr:ribonuclease E/G [Rhodopila sp.]